MEVSSVNRWPWVALLLAALLGALWLLHPILLPFLLGALIAYLGDPAVDRLEARGYRRTTGVVCVFLLFSLLLAALLLIAIPLLIEQVDQLIQAVPVFYRALGLRTPGDSINAECGRRRASSNRLGSGINGPVGVRW